MTDNDDEIRGHLLSRREAIAILGATGLAYLSGCNGGSAGSAQAGAGATTGVAADPGTSAASFQGCVVRPEMTEGPYFVDEKLNRSDIRSDPSDGTLRPGTPLRITFDVSRLAASSCVPLAGAMVDVWHCDHLGVYSDVTDPRFNSQGKKFLRGYQVTDASGKATFDTIYPGWYQGRAVHIHFKIRTDPAGSRGQEFTSQLFFDESVNDRVHAQAPYAAKGRRDRMNENDGIFMRGGGSQLILPVVASGGGYAGTFTIALQG